MKLPRILLLVLSAFLVVGCGGGSSSNGGSTSPGVLSGSLLGAHYYVWYPRNFQQGYLRNKLIPAQEPLLGEYTSANRDVIEQHIDWAADSGIDFFTLDWWRNSPERKSAILDGFLNARNLGKMKFCVFYETGELGFSQGTGATFITDESIEEFLADLEIFRTRLFNQPQYLTVGGKPLLILYVTRTFSGKYREMIARGREYLRSKGTEVFLVGDEIFWAVTTADSGSPAAFTDQPQAERIKLFDAITAYNLYESQFPQHSGYGSDSTFIADVNALYARYRAAAGGVPILPSIIPGYNDRGVRPSVDHYAIPRAFSAGAAEGTLFAELFDRVLIPNLNGQLPIGFITSWNEWNEDTAIEPVAPASATTDDVGDGFFTQGYSYAGYGMTYLDVIKQKRGRL